MSLVITSLEDDTPGQKLAHAYGVIRQQELGENVTLAGVPSVVVDAINRTKNLANRIRVWEAYLESQVRTRMPRQVFHPDLRNALEISHRAMRVLDKLLENESGDKDSLLEAQTNIRDGYDVQLRLILQTQKTISKGSLDSTDRIITKIHQVFPIDPLMEHLIYEGEGAMISEILGVRGYSGVSEDGLTSPFLSEDGLNPITPQDLVARTAA